MFRTTFAIAASLLITTAAFGQEAEFGRASAGAIEATMKRPSLLSGSLGLSLSRGLTPFSTLGNSGRGFNANAGGMLIKDRLWFFGSGQLNQTTQFAPAVAGAPKIILGTMSSQINDRQSLTTSFNSATFANVPSSFLSLHYTGILSPNSSFSVSVNQQKSKTVLIP